MTASAVPPGVRLLMRQMREIMAAPGGAQARLDRFVRVIAANLVTDVCSVYLRREGGALELCATVGLAAAAVHRTRLAPGEGLVGRVARDAAPVNAPDAPNHPDFSFRPETEEEGVVSFLGAPILRGGRLLGVVTAQNRTARLYDDEEVEALQTAAMILAEVVAEPGFADARSLAGLELRPSRPERLLGRPVSTGYAIGPAAKREAHVPPARLIADDPESEAERVESAIHRLREGVDALLAGRSTGLGEQGREVLEAYRMFAHDRGWLERLKEAARSGLTAEAAVERVRNEQRARLLSAPDPYLRERLHDLEDLADRLLRHIAEADGAPLKRAPPPEGAVLFARAIGPGELLELGGRIAGLVIEEGAGASHAAIVARALAIPFVGEAQGALDRVEDGDQVVVDGASGEVHLRPPQDVVQAYKAKIALSGRALAAYAKIRDKPSVTKDGRRVHLMMNAGLLIDLPQIARTGADGIGLFRTEFQFMVSEALPRAREQHAIYSAALDAAGERPVVFRTLDLGGDKPLPYAKTQREENPALGWRAIRMALDRPGLLRYQLRALIAAASGRVLRVMFPLLSLTEEFLAARALVHRELERNTRRGRLPPASVEIGAMCETPAMAFGLESLLAHADFVSIGANDLMQFFFAADRDNPRLAHRYDILSPPALSFLKTIADACRRRGRPVSVCGEAAGRPLEALALIALGFDRLSMPAPAIAGVKRLVLGLDATAVAERLLPQLGSSKASLREDIAAIAADLGAPV